jgi:hypothetical protein
VISVFGRFQEEGKPKPVRKCFDFVLQFAGKTIGFNATGEPYHITEPITKTYNGISYIYLCTRDGSIYSTTDLQQLDEKGDI